MGLGALVKGALVGFFSRLFIAIFKTPMATATFLYALIGGLALSDTFLGDWISTVLNWGPWWLPAVAAVIAFLTILGDLGRDGVAERFAIYLALVTPSFAMSIPESSGLHKDLAGWIKDLTGWFTRTIGEYIGATGAEAMKDFLAFTSIAVAVLVCERYGKKTGASNSGAPRAAAGPAAVGPVGPAARRATRA